MSGIESLIKKIGLRETLDRIESGRACPILGAAAQKPLAPMAVLVRRSLMRLR